jgi:hypothetical protein
MNLIIQALIAIIHQWKVSLIFGILVSLAIFLLNLCGSYGIMPVSILILIAGNVFSRIMTASIASPPLFSYFSLVCDFSVYKKSIIGFLIGGLAITPTGVLFGSALGLLHSHQDQLGQTMIAFWLLMLCSFVFLVFSHGVSLNLGNYQGLAKSLDSSVLSIFKQFRLYLTASFFMGLSLVLADFLFGYGWFISVPFIFSVCHFQFIELKKREAFTLRKAF